MEGIAELFHEVLNGSTEQMTYAAATLQSLEEDPQYVPNLVNIINTAEYDDNIRLSAAIQYKNRVLNGAPPYLDFEQLNTLIVTSPPLVQLQLQFVLSLFIEDIILQGQIETLLETITRFIQGDAYHALVAILILRCMVKLEGKYKENAMIINQGLVSIQDIFSQLADLVGQNVDSVDCSLFIHLTLLTASKFMVQNGEMPGIEQWIFIIQRILQSPSSQTYPYLDKDAIKLAHSFFKVLSPETSANLMMLIANHVIQGVSIKTSVFSFKYIHLALTTDSLWPYIEEHQLDLVGSLFFKVYVLSQQNLIDINDDLHNFISNTLVITEASSALSFAVQKHFSLAQLAIQIVLCELASYEESGDVTTAFGALEFASVVLTRTPSQFTMQSVDLIIRSVKNLLPTDNYILLAGFFLFISVVHYEYINDERIFLMCFEQILLGLHPLTQYHAAHAAANLIPKFQNTQKKDELITYFGQNITNILSIVLSNSQYLATDRSVITIRVLFDFFIEQVVPLAFDYVNELFTFFNQLMQDVGVKDNSITTCVISIKKVCKLIRDESEDSIAFFASALEEAENLICSVQPSNYIEDILDLITCFVNYTTQVGEPFLKVPQVLAMVVEKSGNEYISPVQVVNIFKIFAMKCSNYLISDGLFEPMIQIANYYLASMPEYEDTDYTEEEEAVITLFQIIFVLLKDSEPVKNIAPQFIDIINTMNPETINAIIAALATTAPALTFQNEANFRAWSNLTSPEALLCAAISMFNEWDTLPEYITSIKVDINQLIMKNIEILNEKLKEPEIQHQKFEALMEEHEKFCIFDPNQLINYFLSSDFE